MKKILIVDDSQLIRRSLRNLLEQRAEWRICGEAENGREGVEQAQKFCPDLILLDLSMPLMNGFQAARELQRLMPKVPILMFTTFKTSQIEQEAHTLGIRAVRSKSEGIDCLLPSIDSLLN